MRFLLLVLSLTLSSLAFADDRQDHFKGKPSETLEQAVANFREYNARLADLVKAEKLSARDVHTVHELTYTLEKALEKIREELGELADVLEEVHVASEKHDTGAVKARGQAYLDTAAQVIR